MENESKKQSNLETMQIIQLWQEEILGEQPIFSPN